MIHSKETVSANLAKLNVGGFIYLASPYTRLASTIGLDEAARIASVAAGALMSEGLVVFSPIAHGHMISDHYAFDKTDQSFWMNQCYPVADAAALCVVLMLDGWQSSSGVRAEIELFKSAGKPVVYVFPHELGIAE